MVIDKRLTLQDMRDCAACGAVFHIRVMQRVQRIEPKLGITAVWYLCPADRLHYDQHTTTSGYDRYYLEGKEVAAPYSVRKVGKE